MENLLSNLMTDAHIHIEASKDGFKVRFNWVWLLIALAVFAFIFHFTFWLYSDQRNDGRYVQKAQYDEYKVESKKQFDKLYDKMDEIQKMLIQFSSNRARVHEPSPSATMPPLDLTLKQKQALSVAN